MTEPMFTQPQTPRLRNLKGFVNVVVKGFVNVVVKGFVNVQRHRHPTHPTLTSNTSATWRCAFRLLPTMRCFPKR